MPRVRGESTYMCHLNLLVTATPFMADWCKYFTHSEEEREGKRVRERGAEGRSRANCAAFASETIPFARGRFHLRACRRFFVALASLKFRLTSCSPLLAFLPSLSLSSPLSLSSFLFQPLKHFRLVAPIPSHSPDHMMFHVSNLHTLCSSVFFARAVSPPP